MRGRERPGRSEMNKSVPVCHDVHGQHGRPYVMDVAGVADKTKALYLLQMLLRFVVLARSPHLYVLNHACNFVSLTLCIFVVP